MLLAELTKMRNLVAVNRPQSLFPSVNDERRHQHDVLSRAVKELKKHEAVVSKLQHQIETLERQLRKRDETVSDLSGKLEQANERISKLSERKEETELDMATAIL